MFHPSNITDLQKKSWASLFAWCIGKTSLSVDDPQYATIVQLGEILVDYDIGIIHGWYEDGSWWWVMQAFAQWASQSIKRNHRNIYYNIWVPEQRFTDKRWEESYTKFDTQFTDPLPHMDIRCGVVVDAIDILVVSPVAWNGTLREVFTMYERNDIHRPSNLWYGKITPIIFYGDNWKNLFHLLDDQFALGTSVSDDKNLYFVNSIEQFTQAVIEIKNILIKK